MFHPLEGDVQNISDQELEKTLSDLNKKYYQAARLGKPELLTQVETFVIIYRNEMSRRHQIKLQSGNNNLEGLINVD
jgi:hypothetical protein